MRNTPLSGLLSAIVILSSVSCANTTTTTSSLPEHKVGIVAHRGFWNCEEAGYAQNSVAALRQAQLAGFWGSEFDVQLTADTIVVSNHDKEYGPYKWHIIDHTYAELRLFPLPNGETLPTLSDYLRQGRECATTKLVLEFKKQRTDELTLLLVEKTMQIIREEGLFDPSRIMFISFSKPACLHIAKTYPQFDCQYLTGNMSASALKKAGLTGADYHQALYNRSKVKSLHKQGLDANVWTVDSPKKMSKLFSWGIDYITTNEPLKARELLKGNEKQL